MQRISQHVAKVAAKLAVLALAAVVAMPASAGAWAGECRKLYSLTDVNHAIEPGVFVPATDELPNHCRVRGVVNRAIRFEVTMPVNVCSESPRENCPWCESCGAWQGRLMFTAVGGTAGTIGDTTSLLARGFAMASTDTGHEASEGNAFLAQPEALLDYAYRGVHLATLAAKQIVEHYYGEDIRYSYLQGCSNGGRAAMLGALRFPEDYDGIIAGAPAFRFQEFLPWMIAMHRAQTANPLTPAALRVLDNASREACDTLDGVEDGVIDDPRLCDAQAFDLDALACAAGQTEGCLSVGQIETARAVYRDWMDADGNVISPGVPPGAEAAGDWAAWMLPNDQFGGDSIIGQVGEMLTLLKRHDPNFDFAAFDPIADRAAIADETAPLDVGSADLSEFRDRGGKLLMYQGWNDYPLRPGRAIDYLAEVERSMGGAAKIADFFRLFMVPGMVHCAGGPGPWQADYVDPLVAWREMGKPPQRIIGEHPGPVPMPHIAPDEGVAQERRFSRPLCPYPQFAQYKGRGDQNDASSFKCVAD